ncbi:MAG TPA: hypothetical protein VFA85_01005 [Terriglobales bacterium]|nr:hypothetical protein [Terriglobales bacterium]
MRDRLIAGLSVLVLLMGLGWYSSVHAQTREMARHEPHMSAAIGHLEQAKAELEKATANKGGYREKAMQLVDEALQQTQEGERYYEQHH